MAEEKSLEDTFNAATEFVKTLTSVSNADALDLYAYFKLSSTGPLDESEHPRPGFFDQKGRAKWDAWKSKGSLPKEEAMQAYINKVNELSPGWETSS